MSARHWIGCLAQHVNQLESPDLAWWRLGTTMNRFSAWLWSGS
ncbi:hypothetical protein [Streptomyces olivochromogenes]|uniref:Uncharacterized protein n=1 Tax=Streptomyces olivochromogenes TaxID=1963 RepID=A0A250VTZ6_STROL|nr:hypothetical protein [Streptomyces olivochromogenes]GAX57611.1 hypothetical protein SO3561_09181 [Streptomyces olivochromogenes]